jgi:membrane protein implicated in regulation of membrane protease activity
MGRFMNTLVTGLTLYLGIFAAKIVVSLIAVLTILAGWSLYSRDRKKGSKYFENLTVKQKIGILFIVVGLLPFTDVIIGSVAYAFAGSLFD